MARLARSHNRIIMENTRGFSLIEVLIVIVMLGFVLVAAVTFGNNIRSSNESRILTGEMADRQSVFTSQITKDFEAVGYNLKGSFENNGSGQVAPLFFSSRDYNVGYRDNTARITRQYNTGEADLLSAWGLVRGSGEVSFTPETMRTTVGFRDSNNDSYTFYFINSEEWQISIAGEIFNSNESNEIITAGDRVSISLDSSENGGCAMTFYFLRDEERRLVIRRPINCNYQFQALVNLRQGGALGDFTLRGSWFNRLDLNSETTVMPAFPVKNQVPSTVPVWIENQGSSFTLLKSDLTADASTTLSSAEFNDEYGEVEFTVSNPLRGEFALKDFCLLIDDSSHKTVLGKISQIERRENETTVILTPVSKEVPAWEDFYSDTSDYLGHNFPVGSRLVRLSAPVTYRFAASDLSSDTQNAERVLLRREGLAPWEQVAFGITESVLRHDNANGQNNFILNFSILPEDATSVDPRPVSITFSPAGLNAR
jgi:prepilin-type N-terminal cleavage/methylation domain-containing protein